MPDFAVIIAERIPELSNYRGFRPTHFIVNRNEIANVMVYWDFARTTWCISFARVGDEACTPTTRIATQSSAEAQDIVRELTGVSLVLQIPTVTE